MKVNKIGTLAAYGVCASYLVNGGCCKNLKDVKDLLDGGGDSTSEEVKKHREEMRRERKENNDLFLKGLKESDKRTREVADGLRNVTDGSEQVQYYRKKRDERDRQREIDRLRKEEEYKKMKNDFNKATEEKKMEMLERQKEESVKEEQRRKDFEKELKRCKKEG